MNLVKALLPFTLYNQREVSCTTLIIFLAIAQSEEGILQADLPDKLQMSSSSVSRNCCLLGLKTQKNQNGMGLITREVHPHDARINVLKLTTEGRQLYDQLLNCL
jgi:DNA-binding MarR family transcriptional regulator